MQLERLTLNSRHRGYHHYILKGLTGGSTYYPLEKPYSRRESVALQNGGYRFALFSFINSKRPYYEDITYLVLYDMKMVLDVVKYDWGGGIKYAGHYYLHEYA